MDAKSLYRNYARSHFFRAEYEIWADFGQVGNTKRNKIEGTPILKLAMVHR